MVILLKTAETGQFCMPRFSNLKLSSEKNGFQSGVHAIANMTGFKALFTISLKMPRTEMLVPPGKHF